MLEIYGWINLIEADDDGLTYDQICARREAVGKEIEAWFASRGSRAVALTRQTINGNVMISLLGSSNHASPDRENVIELLRLAGAKAPGSYGLLYVKDEEAPGGHSDAFVVWALRKGAVQELNDVIMSPCSLKL